jgi:hypothetical protein
MKENSRHISGLAYALLRAVALEMANAEQWRQLYKEALDRFDPGLQKTMIDQARTAIFDRLLDLCDLSGSHQDEETLLEDALRQLWIAENRKPN